MARSTKEAPDLTRRGSPEAIQKRRVARRLNALLGGQGAGGGTLTDGRTEKRRRRLLSDLERAIKKGAAKLKPIEVLQRVEALLQLGEPLSAIRKVAPIRESQARSVPETVQLLKDVHVAYGFRPDTYRFLGVPYDTLVAAGLIPASTPRRGRPRKHPRA